MKTGDVRQESSRANNISSNEEADFVLVIIAMYLDASFSNFSCKNPSLSLSLVLGRFPFRFESSDGLLS